MTSIDDWVAKAAREIFMMTVFWNWQENWSSHKMEASEERIAAIIAEFAEPLVALLREPRLHLHVEGDPYLCCPLCTRCEGTRNSSWNGGCHPDCGADAWNARVEAVLAGQAAAGGLTGKPAVT